MSASDEVWILGIQMTKFGKHPDLDTVDLAAEAATGALSDAGVTMADIGVLAAGNLMNASAGIGQQLQKQIGQTGIPVYNVANACATGATALRTAIMAVKAGEVDYGLAVESRSSPAQDYSAEAARARRTPTPGRRRDATVQWHPSTDGSAPRQCPVCSRRSAWSTATNTAARASSCSPRSARRITPTRR